MKRIARKFILICGMSFALGASVIAQNTGAIEHSDNAPPPNDQQKQEGKTRGARAERLSEQITRITTAILVTDRLSQAMATDPAAENGAAQIDAAKWRNAGGALVIFAGDKPTWTFNADAIAPYVAASIELAKTIAATPRKSRPTNLEREISEVTNTLSLALDDMLAEHGLLNASLRYYPYSSVAEQAPLDCALVNRYSRDFRCMSQSKVASPDTSDWLYNRNYSRADWCVTSTVQNYAVKYWPDTVTLVRTASFQDHLMLRANTEGVIAAPHARDKIRPQC